MSSDVPQTCAFLRMTKQIFISTNHKHLNIHPVNAYLLVSVRLGEISKSEKVQEMEEKNKKSKGQKEPPEHASKKCSYWP